MRKKKDYAVYKGDEFIDLGTVDYLSEKLNIKPLTLVYYARPCWRKKIKESGNAIIVIALD